MKILSVIMARGGSKGVPRKNLREINGLPLLAFKARAAQRARHASRVIVSTDSSEIQAVAQRYDVEVPFTRPDELASDHATNFAVLQHAIAHFDARNEFFDAVLMLEPSSPFTTPGDIDAAVELMLAREASLVVSMRDVDNPAPFVGPIEADGRITQIITQLQSLKNVNRQVLPHAYTLNGLVYLIRTDGFRGRSTFYWDAARSYGFVTDPVRSVEIDSELNLAWAEFLVNSGRIALSPWI